MLGPAALGFAPSGPQLAFIGPGEGDRIAPLPIGPLRIVDAGSGDVRTLPVKDVVSFFWSPDGRTIATLGVPSAGNPDAASAGDDSAMSPGRGPAAVRLASTGAGPGAARPVADAPGVPVSLAFVDVAKGTATAPVIVSLTPLFVNQVLPYFDQYALSHRLWSPDGASILLPVVGADGVESLDLLPADGSAPRVLVPGRSGSGAPEPLAARSERPDEHEDADDHQDERPHEVAHVGHRDARRADREQDHAEHQLPAPARAADARARAR